MSDVELNVLFSQVSRIGAMEKAQHCPRPIKARTTCVADHRNILKTIPKIHETEGYRDIGIRRDDTPLERDQSVAYPGGVSGCPETPPPRP